MINMSEICAVVADIGGTNTRVALTKGATVQTSSIKRYSNSEYESIYAVLKEYLEEQGVKPDAACVAMAGPVRDGVGSLTNLDWRVERDAIAEATGAQTVAVLNDLQAQGHALGNISKDHLQTIRLGALSGSHAAQLMLGVGTGMNAALVYRTDHGTLVPPSESGHVTLPILTEEEIRLQSYLARKHGLPGAEDVLSGRGFERLYAWLCEEDGDGQPLKADEIMKGALSGDNQRARRAAQIFVRFLGRTAANLALVQLPFGGIYLCGGVARHFGPLLDQLGFEEAFLDKGRFSEFMDQFPVYLITDDYAALTGSACHLIDLLTHKR